MKRSRQKAVGSRQKARIGRGAALPFPRLVSGLSSFVFRFSPFASRFLFSAFCFLFTAYCLLPTAYSSPSDERPVVRVATETVAQSDRLKLGDVAEVKAKDEATAERLREVGLGYAPNVGALRELEKERIALAITAAGFSKDAVRLEGPEVALIRRAAQTVDPALVREAVESAALADLTARGATARLVKLDLPAVIEVPTGKVEARASIRGVRDLFSPFIVSIEVWIDGVVARRLSATAQVEAFAPVIVAARALAENSRVRKEDVAVEVRKLERPASFYLRETEKLRGMAVRRTVAKGEAITTDALAAEIVIQTGDKVRIVSESGKLQVMATGEARSAGRIGDRIQVKNTQSGAMLQAVIVDEGLVTVRF